MEFVRIKRDYNADENPSLFGISNPEYLENCIRDTIRSHPDTGIPIHFAYETSDTDTYDVATVVRTEKFGFVKDVTDTDCGVLLENNAIKIVSILGINNLRVGFIFLTKENSGNGKKYALDKVFGARIMFCGSKGELMACLSSY
jgi:hypothetical protein